MNIKSEIIKILDYELKQFNFKRKNLKWNFDWIDNLIIVELQKSNWSNWYYINLTVYNNSWADKINNFSFYDYSDRLENIFIKDKSLKKIYCFDDLSNELILNEIEVIKTNILRYIIPITSLWSINNFKQFIIKYNKMDCISLRIRKIIWN